MERVLSQDERIRRAEELYARRKMQVEYRNSATVNVKENKSNQLRRKLIKQFIICVLIYISFYTMKNIPNLVSQEVMYKISDILEYDVNIQELYKNISNYMAMQGKNKAGIKEDTNTLIEETLSVTDNSEVQGSNEIMKEEVTETENVETTAIEESSSLSQMQIDAEYIKANYTLIKPLEGEITSRFGIRNPTVATVPKYHTGIDIARVIGTVIISAMEGTVELVSSEGDLRKSYKNNKWRIKYSVCTL